MQLDQIKQQQVNLLVRKALLQDEVKAIENSLAQIAAIVQYADANAAQPAAEDGPLAEKVVQ